MVEKVEENVYRISFEDVPLDNEDELIEQIKIDSKTGIAWVHDGSTGLRYTVHPNIHYTGKISGMRKHFGWGRYDRIRRFKGYKYNIDILSYNRNSKLETELASRCQCEACLERKSEWEKEG